MRVPELVTPDFELVSSVSAERAQHEIPSTAQTELRAFYSDSRPVGNYLISVETTPDPERKDVAEFDDLPQMNGDAGGRVRWEMLNIRSVVNSFVPSRPTTLWRCSPNTVLAKHRELLGIQHKVDLWPDGLRSDTIAMTVGADAINAALENFHGPAAHYGFADSRGYLDGEDLLGHLRAGNFPVQGRPGEDSLAGFEEFVFPLHDNVMHVLAVSMLGSQAVREFADNQLSLFTDPGEHQFTETTGRYDTFFANAWQHFRPETYISWADGDAGDGYKHRISLGSNLIVDPVMRRAYEREMGALTTIQSSGLTAEEYEGAYWVKEKGKSPTLDRLDELTLSISRRYGALFQAAAS